MHHIVTHPEKNNAPLQTMAHQNQSKASRQFAQPSLLRLGEKKAKTKTTI